MFRSLGSTLSQPRCRFSAHIYIELALDLAEHLLGLGLAVVAHEDHAEADARLDERGVDASLDTLACLA